MTLLTGRRGCDDSNSSECQAGIPAWPKDALRVSFGIIWLIGAILKWLPGFRSACMGTIMGQAQGQPGWLRPWFDFWISLQHPRAMFFAYLVAVVEAPTAIIYAVVFAALESPGPAADHAELRGKGVDVGADLMGGDGTVPLLFFFRDNSNNQLMIVQAQ